MNAPASPHTPGPWHLIERGSEIRIHPDWNGRPGGVALTIGSTAFSFRARRQGSRRGEKMVYLPFSEQDRADARLVAVSPAMLQALREVAGDLYILEGTRRLDDGPRCRYCDAREGQPHDEDCTGAAVLAAIAKAEGR